MVIKFIRDPTTKVFTYKDCEYNIDPTAKYEKKFLGIKTFFFSMYEQDYPDPLRFEEGRLIRNDQDIPIGELAYFIRLLKKDNLTKIAEIMAIVGGIAGIIAVYYVYQNNQMLTEIQNYLSTMGHVIQQIHDTVVPAIPEEPIIPGVP